MKLVKSILIFLLLWALVGTGISVVISLLVGDSYGIGSIVGFIWGIYAGYKSYKENKVALF